MFTPMGYVVLGMGVTGGLGLSMIFSRISQLFSAKVRHEAHFSPAGGVTEAIVRHIGKARREILLQGFTINARPISEALVAAKSRGVHVEILIDSINEKDPTSDLNFLLDSGLDPQIDDNHGVAHNKIILLDNKTLITGSFNFTRQSEEENAENILVVEGVSHLIHAYRESYLIHKSHARPSLRAGGMAAKPIAQAQARPMQPQAQPQPAQPRPQPAPQNQPQPAAAQIRPQGQPNSNQPVQNPGIPGQPAHNNTPSVAASLANMGLQGQPAAANAPTSQFQALHQGHGQIGHPSTPQSHPVSGGVTTANGNQVTPEMLRAMVQNAANARG
jgi:hypothetical protein